jgi:ABC-type dipeptide/oligopeptide/nickel transport system permease subunit
MAEAGLSFLGIGAQPPTPSWGLMITQTKEYLFTAPWNALFPGAAILFTVLAFNFLGDALRDALDPFMKR